MARLETFKQQQKTAAAIS